MEVRANFTSITPPKGRVLIKGAVLLTEKESADSDACSDSVRVAMRDVSEDTELCFFCSGRFLIRHFVIFFRFAAGTMWPRWAQNVQYRMAVANTPAGRGLSCTLGHGGGEEIVEAHEDRFVEIGGRVRAERDSLTSVHFKLGASRGILPRIRPLLITVCNCV